MIWDNLHIEAIKRRIPDLISLFSLFTIQRVTMTWLDLSSLVLTVYSITLIAGLPGNLLSLYAFVQKVKQGAKATDMLLLSLNISDLIFLFFLPIGIKEAPDLEWNISFFLCPLSTYIFLVNIYNSTLLLTDVSVDRYLGVAFAIKYKLKQHPRYAVTISVIIYIYIIYILVYMTRCVIGLFGVIPCVEHIFYYIRVLCPFKTNSLHDILRSRCLCASLHRGIAQRH